MNIENKNNTEVLPLVSVYIPTHNRLETLKRAIKSIQCQTFENIEILVCDDASTDGTFDYVNDLIKNDKRIRYFRNEHPSGACAARNMGIFKAKGKFITGLDDDDEFTEDRIEFLIKKWQDKYSFICCNFLDKYKNKKGRLFYSKKELIGNYTDLLFENVCSNQIFTLTCRMVSIGGFDTRVRRLQDWDTWLRLSYKYGTFKRFGCHKYIMHHDENISRVSKSYTLSEAFRDLQQRNSSLYNEQDKKYASFLIDYFSGNITLIDSVYWSFRKKRAAFMLKYVLFLIRYIFLQNK